MGKAAWFSGLAGLLLLTGCPRPVVMCEMKVSRLEVQSPKPETWSELLLYGHQRQQGGITRPPLDCTGVPVAWQEPRADECLEPGPTAEPLPPAAAGTQDDDLTVKIVGPARQLVWLRTERFSNGEAQGPVALVSTEDNALSVQTIGTLRSLPLTALRLERMGSSDVLVVEGEICSKGEHPVCRSTTRILPVRNGRFVALPVVSPEGHCLGPDWFPRYREQTYPLGNGMLRKIEQTATIHLGTNQIVINESIDVRDQDPRQKETPEPFHTSKAKRTLELQKARIVGDSPSAWVNVIEKFAAGAVPAPSPTDIAPLKADATRPPATAVPAKPAGPDVAAPVLSPANATSKPPVPAPTPASSTRASPKH